MLSNQFEEHSHIKDQLALAAQDAANARRSFSQQKAVEAAARRGDSWAMRELGQYDEY